MGYIRLRDIEKLYFGYEEISRTLGISKESARVTASRYAGRGLLVRIRRNVYVLRERWENLTREERFALANMAQVPSYVSLMTALGYYDVTTQIQQRFVECIGMRRTKEIEVDGWIFRYSKIDRKRYFGFEKLGGAFVASPEKALVDAVYLSCRGLYRFDADSIDLGKLNKRKVESIAGEYPGTTQEALRKWMS